MAIRTATIGRHRSLSGLAKTLFDLRGSNVTLADAEAALLRANPHLADQSGFVRGATVIVPDLRGPATLATATARTDVGEATQPVAAQLAQTADLAAKAIDQALAEAKAGLEALADRSLVALLNRTRPDIAGRFPDILKAAKEDAAALDATAAALRKALEKAAGDLKALG